LYLSWTRTWLSHIIVPILNFPSTFICCVLYLFLIIVQWFEVRGCSFCRHWFNCWPSVFKLSIHNLDYINNKYNTVYIHRSVCCPNKLYFSL
jgi:hypothetical protein